MENQFIANLYTCHHSFLITEWDHRIPQCDITFNHLRSLRCQTKLPYHAYLFGNSNFNCIPLGVPGTMVLPHKTLQQYHTFAPHGIEGFYVGHSEENYCWYKVFLASTNSTRDTSTLDCFPHAVPLPQVTPDTSLKQTLEEMLTLIQDNSHHKLDIFTYGYALTKAYIQVAQILRQATSRPEPIPASASLPLTATLTPSPIHILEPRVQATT